MPSNETRTAVAIGSNLGNRYANLLAAEQQLMRISGTWGHQFSSIYATKAMTEYADPDYLNGVVTFMTSLSAEALLLELQRIEDAAHRVRPYRNAPRTLDLDLLLFGSKIIDTENLNVPHPRMHERLFVLIPLNELLPDFEHPGIHQTISSVKELLERRCIAAEYVLLDQRKFRLNGAGAGYDGHRL